MRVKEICFPTCGILFIFLSTVGLEKKGIMKFDPTFHHTSTVTMSSQTSLKISLVYISYLLPWSRAFLKAKTSIMGLCYQSSASYPSDSWAFWDTAFLVPRLGSRHKHIESVFVSLSSVRHQPFIYPNSPHLLVLHAPEGFSLSGPSEIKEIILCILTYENLLIINF